MKMSSKRLIRLQDNQIPFDCHMILVDKRDLALKKRFLNNEEAYQFKANVRKECPCQVERSQECPLPLNSKFRNIHCWFDQHGKEVPNWPFIVEYPCNKTCATYRHYHSSYYSRETFLSIKQGKGKNHFISFPPYLKLYLKSIGVLTVKSTSERFPLNRVAPIQDRNVPFDCDLILVDKRKKIPIKRFLNAEEAYQLKHQIKKECPCQKGQTKCPESFGRKFSDIHYWLDGHRKEVPDWPFVAKYVCKGPCAAFRHTHSSHYGRAKSLSKLKRKGKNDFECFSIENQN